MAIVVLVVSRKKARHAIWLALDYVLSKIIGKQQMELAEDTANIFLIKKRMAERRDWTFVWLMCSSQLLF